MEERNNNYPAFNFHTYRTKLYDTSVTFIILAVDQPENPLTRFEHIHGEPEFFFLIDGKMTCLIDSKEVEFEAPCVVLVPPGMKHATNLHLNECCCISCNLTMEGTRRTQLRDFFYTATNGCTTFAECQMEDSDLRNLHNLYTELSSDEFFREEKVNAYFVLLMTDIIEKLNTRLEEDCYCFKRTTEALSKEVQTKLLSKQIIDYINFNCGKDISIKELADLVHMSVGNMQRTLNNVVGSTFTDLLCEARTNRAKSLIWRTDRSLSIISEECGYGSYEAFYKQFKQRVGMSPQQYRDLTSSGNVDREIPEGNIT